MDPADDAPLERAAANKKARGVDEEDDDLEDFDLPFDPHRRNHWKRGKRTEGGGKGFDDRYAKAPFGLPPDGLPPRFDVVCDSVRRKLPKRATPSGDREKGADPPQAAGPDTPDGEPLSLGAILTEPPERSWLTFWDGTPSGETAWTSLKEVPRLRRLQPKWRKKLRRVEPDTTRWKERFANKLTEKMMAPEWEEEEFEARMTSYSVAKRGWMRIWTSVPLVPIRCLYYVLKVMTLHLIGRRPLFDPNQVFAYALLGLATFAFVLGPAAFAQETSQTKVTPQGHFIQREVYESYMDSATIKQRHFPVYDCDDRNTKFVAIDLTQTKSCPDPESDYDQAYQRNVLVMQVDTKTLVDVHICEAYYTKEVTRCGALHQTYGSDRPAIDERLMIGAEDCRNWAKTSIFSLNTEYLGGQSQHIRLQPGGMWTYYDYYSHGSRDIDGYCDWDNWSWRGVSYKKSYEKTMLRARLRKVKGVLNPETGSLIAGGIIANFKDTTVTDSVTGTMVWEGKQRNCTEAVSMLYEGEVTVHRLSNPKEPRKHDVDPWAGTIVVLDNDEEKQTGAFVIKPKSSTCLPMCHRTHIPGIVVCLQPHRVLQEFDYKPGAHQNIKTLMAAIAHTMVTGSFEQGRKFTRLQQQLCDVSLEGKLHQLGDIAGNQNGYALRRLVIPGVPERGRKYLPGGSAGYVAACPEKNATLFAFANCTLEIPIVLHQETEAGKQPKVLFADPITMVVQSLPTIVPCSSTLPIRWLIRDRWFCSSPETKPCLEPARLGTDMDLQGMGPSPTDFDPLDGVLYSADQQAQNDAYERSLSSRLPIIQTMVNNINRGTVVDANGNIHYGLPFDVEQVDDLAFQVTGRAFFFVSWLGRYYTAVVGFLFLLAVLKLVGGISIRFYVLYRRKGCGIWLLFSLWHTAYLVFGLPWKVAKGVYDTAMEEVDKAQQEGLEPGNYEHLNRAVKGLADGLEQQQALMYQREDKLESFLKCVASSDHNLAGYARTLLTRDEANPSLPSQASTQDKGPKASP